MSIKTLRSALLPSDARKAIVNVATVPLRSPFRYPGGKTWLVPYVRLWLSRQPRRPALLVEPFAGGATVALTAVFENLADSALLVELDEAVAAVWEVILQGQGPELAECVLSFRLTEESLSECLHVPAADRVHQAFQTIVRNRVSRGGIMAPGAGIVRLGENGRGLLSRWYPQTLARRILAIHHLRSRFKFVRGDGMQIMADMLSDSEATFFVDPPYLGAGKRLYRHNVVDHDRLFSICSSVAGDILMTYDEAPEVVALARAHGLLIQRVPMKTTHHHEKYELLIGRDFSWMEDPTGAVAVRRPGDSRELGAQTRLEL